MCGEERGAVEGAGREGARGDALQRGHAQRTRAASALRPHPRASPLTPTQAAASGLQRVDHRLAQVGGQRALQRHMRENGELLRHASRQLRLMLQLPSECVHVGVMREHALRVVAGGGHRRGGWPLHRAAESSLASAPVLEPRLDLTRVSLELCCELLPYFRRRKRIHRVDLLEYDQDRW